MKKILLGTTAIIALSTFSAEAFAAEKIQLSLGGFMNQYVGLSNHDQVSPEANMSLGQRSSTEIYFRGSTTLDNGLTVAVDVQREGDKSASGNDISALTVSSDAMGAVTLGGTTHASDDMMVGAPGAGPLDFMDASGDGWAVTDNTSFDATYGVRGIQTGAGDKNLKMKYVTPTFSGITLGLSYDAAGNVNGNKAGSVRADGDDASSVAMMFEGEVGGASVAAAIARTHINGSDTRTSTTTSTAVGTATISTVAATTGNDYTVDHIGLNVGMAGFTVGGSYNNYNAAAARNDGNAYEIGVAYETGPYAVSLGYTNSKKDNATTGLADSKDTEWLVGGSYSLGGGVSLAASYFNTKATAAGATNSKASGLMGGIEVGF